MNRIRCWEYKDNQCVEITSLVDGAKVFREMCEFRVAACHIRGGAGGGGLEALLPRGERSFPGFAGGIG